MQVIIESASYTFLKNRTEKDQVFLQLNNLYKTLVQFYNWFLPLSLPTPILAFTKLHIIIVDKNQNV